MAAATSLASRRVCLKLCFCTASGLAIGIPALIFYSIFRGKVNRLISEMEAATTHHDGPLRRAV
jgi:biopolymer transport protein ExbB/TolQ